MISPSKFPAPPGYDALRNDIIIFSEFSETEGPVPVDCHSYESIGVFDLSSFVVRAMTMDICPHVSQMEAPLDSSSVLEIPNHRCQAFVYRFGLRDLYARGYVRPFCISVVSPFQGKIMKNLYDLETMLAMVAARLKEGNIPVFLKDIEQRIRDLMFTKVKLMEMQESRMPNASLGDLPDIATVSECIQQLEKLRDIVESERQLLLHNDNGTMMLPSSMISPSLLARASSDDKLPILSCCFHGKSPTLSELRVPMTDETPHLIFKHHLYNSVLNDGLRAMATLVLDTAVKDAHELIQATWLKLSSDEISLELAKEDDYILQPNECLLRIGNTDVVNVHVQLPCKNIRNTNPHTTDDTESESYKSFSSDGSLTQSNPGDAASLPSQISSVTLDRVQSSRRSEGFATPESPSPRLTVSVSSSVPTPLNLVKLGLQRSASVDKFWGSSMSGVMQNIPIHQLSSVIFALLKGRPVVILADQRNQLLVTALVQTLSIFVPKETSLETEVVVPWNVAPLTLSDISSIKLIGTCKSSAALIRQVEKQVCVLDYEELVIYSVPYKKGILLDMLLPFKAKLTDERMIQAHIQHGLLEIGRIVLLYFHQCCPLWEDPVPRTSIASSSSINLSSGNISIKDMSNNSASASVRRDLNDVGPHEYLKTLNIIESDVEIIEYLTDLIREQQIRKMMEHEDSDGNGQLSSSSYPHGIHLDFRRPQKISRKPK